METLTYVLFVLVAVVVVAGLGLLIHGTVVKNRWGINLRPVSCPSCGKEMRRVRVPTSGRQAMWGGYTCPDCNCEMDKWGQPIAR